MNRPSDFRFVDCMNVRADTLMDYSGSMGFIVLNVTRLLATCRSVYSIFVWRRSTWCCCGWYFAPALVTVDQLDVLLICIGC